MWWHCAGASEGRWYQWGWYRGWILLCGMCVGGLCAPFLCGDNSEAVKRVDFSVAVSVLSFVLDAGLYCSLIIGDVMAELCVRVVLKEIR